MNIAQIEEIIDVLEKSEISEIAIRKENWGLKVRKGEKLNKISEKKRKEPLSKSKQVQNDDIQETSSEVTVNAPMVGIFHTIECGPKIGDFISSGQVVGIIESMKLMNDVRSDVSGTIKEILVEDGTPVEYGQPVLVISKGEKKEL